jgi:adenylylsulfate kinase
MRVIWFTGLSGSGKTTLANELEILLNQRFQVQVFDGDTVRQSLNKDLTFSMADRYENVRRIAEVSKLLLNHNIVTIACFISPTIEIRKLARDIIGGQFIEVYLNSSLETCEKRDVKGLYEKARSGEIKDFTGISSVYEPPVNPELIINTESFSVEESIIQLMDFLDPVLKKGSFGNVS